MLAIGSRQSEFFIVLYAKLRRSGDIFASSWWDVARIYYLTAYMLVHGYFKEEKIVVLLPVIQRSGRQAQQAASKIDRIFRPRPQAHLS